MSYDFYTETGTAQQIFSLKNIGTGFCIKKIGNILSGIVLSGALCLNNNWIDASKPILIDQHRITNNIQLLQAISFKEKIIELRRVTGLNILEMSSVLKVSRPAMYSWMDGTVEIKPNKANCDALDRLNILHSIFLNWNSAKLGRLTSYLYQPMENNQSLFALLTADTINAKTIKHVLESTKAVVNDKMVREEKHKAFLKNHGFDEISKEDMEDRLMGLIDTAS